MSLNWNAEDVQNLEEKKERWGADVIAQFAFVLYAVKIGYLERKNLMETFIRIKMYEDMYGVHVYQEDPIRSLYGDWLFLEDMLGYGINEATQPVDKWFKEYIAPKIVDSNLRYVNHFTTNLTK